jgi:uncharacterized coiled-coil protein SlyX
MQQQPTTEQRLVLLESRIAELERKAAAQADLDIALLRRVDDFIDDLRRIERVQMRAFEELKATQQEHSAQLTAQDGRLASIETRLDHVERNVDVLVDTAKDHKQAIEGVARDVGALAGNVGALTRDVGALAQGQTQILALLTRQKPND